MDALALTLAVVTGSESTNIYECWNNLSFRNLEKVSS